MKITNKDLAKRIKLKHSTFYYFIKRHPEVLDLVKKGLKYEDLLKDIEDMTQAIQTHNVDVLKSKQERQTNDR